MSTSDANHTDGTDVTDAANPQSDAGLGADLLAVVARLNRLATQRIQMSFARGAGQAAGHDRSPWRSPDR